MKMFRVEWRTNLGDQGTAIVLEETAEDALAELERKFSPGTTFKVKDEQEAKFGTFMSIWTYSNESR